jgi:hypothetical protein
MARRTTLSTLGGILLCCAASTAAREAVPDERAETIKLLCLLIQQTVPGAWVNPVAGEGSDIILCGCVAHVEDIDTVLSIARAVWGENKGRVVCEIKVRALQFVHIDLQLYRINRTGAGAADGELCRRYSEEFGTLRVDSENERELDVMLLQHLESIGQAELVTEDSILPLEGRAASCRTRAGDCYVPDVSGGAPPWIHEEQLQGDLQFMPVVLEDGRIRLSIEMKYPDRHVLSLGTTTLEDGRTAVLAAPDNELEVHYTPAWEDPRPDARDLVLLATVHGVPVQAP